MTNGNLKPWQIVLFVAAVGALGWSIWNVLGSRGVQLKSEMVLVDVVTGDLYTVSTKRLALPAKRPLTGERTLFPVEETEDGEGWALNGRTLSRLPGELSDSNIIDPQSGQVLVPGNPKKYVKPE